MNKRILGVVLFVLWTLFACSNQEEYNIPDYNYHNWAVSNSFECISTEGVVFEFEAHIPSQIEEHIAMCGFYYSKDRNLDTAVKVISDRSYYAFSSKIILNDYNEVYYVAPFISNGHDEIIGYIDSIQVNDLEEYVHLGNSEQIKASEDGSVVTFKGISVSRESGVSIDEYGIIYIKTSDVENIIDLGKRVSTNDNVIEISDIEVGKEYSYCLYLVDGEDVAYGHIKTFTTVGKIILSHDRVDFDVNGNSTSNQIRLESFVAWEIFSKPEWINISPQDGEAGIYNLLIEASPNISVNSRSYSLTIWCKDDHMVYKDIEIYQSGVDIELNNNIECDYHSFSTSFNVPFPQAWSLKTSDDWIMPSATSGSGNQIIEIDIDKNTLKSKRKGYITFTTEGVDYKVDISQTGQYLNLSAYSRNELAYAIDINVGVETNVGKRATVDYNGGFTNWITVEENDLGYNLHISENPSLHERVANLIVVATDNDANQSYIDGVSCEIVQMGRRLSVEENELKFGWAAQNSPRYNIVVDGAFKVTKNSSDDWYEVYTDYEENSFNVVLNANTSDAKRNGVISISLLGLPGGEECHIEIPIIQNRKNGDINLDEWGDDENWDI